MEHEPNSKKVKFSKVMKVEKEKRSDGMEHEPNSKKVKKEKRSDSMEHEPNSKKVTFSKVMKVEKESLDFVPTERVGQKLKRLNPKAKFSQKKKFDSQGDSSKKGDTVKIPKTPKNESKSPNNKKQKFIKKEQTVQGPDGKRISAEYTRDPVRYDKNASPEKAQLLNMKKKERKVFRQKSKKNYELAKQLKTLWEELRSDKIEEERKKKLLSEAYALVKGHAIQLIFAHDTVRAIETLVAVGTEEHRTMLFEELKGSIISLAKSRYAKFFVIKMLKYGTIEQKRHIIKCFHGKVICLMSHTEASSVVENAFNECANATQRIMLVQEFYGPNYYFFKDVHLRNLNKLFEEKPEQKSSIIGHMKSSLEKVLQKGGHKHSIVHYVLREFMTHADPTSRTDMIECLQTVAAEILHTKDGSRVVMSCIWHGSAKARKSIVKNFKSHVTKIAKEQHGHMCLLALFDCVDDTKLIEKSIISEIVKDCKSIFLNRFGRKVVVFLFNPCDTVYFHPDVQKILAQGRENKTSKKDTELRRSELKDIASPLLLKALHGNLKDSLKNNASCLLVATILKYASGDRSDVYQEIAKLASLPYAPAEVGCSMHFVEDTVTGFLLKKLVYADKNTESENGSFSEVFVKNIPLGNLKGWINCNRGTFLLATLLETKIPSVVKRVKDEVADKRDILISKTADLSTDSYISAKILLHCLN